MSEEHNTNQKKENTYPVYIRELTPYPAEKEINLIDLTRLLLRHKLLIFSVLLLSIAVAISYIASLKKIYTYTSHIHIGTYVNNSKIALLERPANLLTKINLSYIPRVLKSSNGNFSLSASVVSKSDIIAISASTISDQETPAVNLLNELNQLILQDHNQLYKALLMESTEAQTGEMTASSGVSGLQNTYVLNEPHASGVVYSKNRKLILVGSIIAGLFLGVFAVFFAEFVSRVRQEVKTSP